MVWPDENLPSRPEMHEAASVVERTSLLIWIKATGIGKSSITGNIISFPVILEIVLCTVEDALLQSFWWRP
jgi:hypothetical protein